MKDDIKEEMQAIQYKIHMYLSQKQNFELKLQEIETAIEELKKEDVSDVYKVVGPIMIKKSKEELIDELEKKKNFRRRV